jgi:hypothetical protein
MRIEAQANAARGLPAKNIVQTYSHIVKENGYKGLFQVCEIANSGDSP